MIRYLYADQLNAFPKLRDTMLRDRAQQFHNRLQWDVSVDENGFERDQYDALNPLYVIWETPMGRHGGSMRFLPTTGDTMVNDFFSHLIGGGAICAPQIWETTRFCVSPEATDGGKIAAHLMLGGAELGVNFGLTNAIGVFDARMVRIYRKLGWSPDVLGTEGTGREAISAGLWEFSETVRAEMAERAGISLALSSHWFRRAFGDQAQETAAAA